MDRRRFLAVSSSIVPGILLRWPGSLLQSDLDRFIQQTLEDAHIAGISAAIVKTGGVVWSKGYGWADIEQRIPMTPDTLQNIGSVSKTITATAVMQLWERGLLQLDDDVDQYLPFSIRNPRYPETAITFRQLLTHRSSIKDGDAYGESYSRGDPVIPLSEWIRQYLTPGGTYYSADDNFHTWKPGHEGQLPTRPRNYSNVGFGLLGYLVEAISGSEFSEYCRSRIFSPLGMKETAWYLRDLDVARHAVPYTYVTESMIEEFQQNPADAMREALPKDEDITLEDIEADSLFPHCLYSFPNYPDGLVRTSVNELGRFLCAYINSGSYGEERILRAETVRTMLSNDHFERGLCWYQNRLQDGSEIWGHGGGDPGISTLMFFSPGDRVGAIVFANTGTGALGSILGLLFEEAAK